MTTEAQGDKISFGKVARPPDDRATAMHFGLRHNVHLRHQGISSLPTPQFRLADISPTPGLPPLTTVMCPNSVDMLTADAERDLLYPAAEVDFSLMGPPVAYVPIPPWQRHAYRPDISGVDFKQPTQGTHEVRQLSLECTKQGYGKCAWCKPEPDPREPSIKQ